MTTTRWLAELDEELSKVPPLAPRLAPPTGPGFAEIKKHNRYGISDGLHQLRTAVRQLRDTGAPKRQPYLITYLSVDKDEVPTEKQDATHLRVFAIDLSGGVPPSMDDVLQRTWMYVGKIPIPAKARPFLSPAKASKFGGAVEGAVRHLFLSKVVNRTRRGGRKPSAHDVVWDELADFYRELAGELSPSGGSFRF